MTHIMMPIHSFRDKREQVMMWAKSQVGTKEDKGPNEDKNGNIADYWEKIHDRRVDRDLNNVGSAYCIVFVSWCFYQANKPLVHNHGNGFTYTPFLERWGKKQGFWIGKRFYKDVQQGDIIMYRGKARAKHAGIVEHVDGPNIHTIEGNYMNGVNYRTVHVRHRNVAGFISPWKE